MRSGSRSGARSGSSGSAGSTWSATRSAHARSASTPWVRLPFSSCDTEVRHEPKARLNGRPSSSVAMTGGGKGESGRGHTCSPPIATV